MRGAERRETPGPARPRGVAANHPDALARRVAPPCDRRRAPLGALLRLFSVPGHAFGSALAFAPPSASSWREVRSDLQVEPRAARVRHACRPRVPPLAPLD